jgi:ribonuclease HI
VPPPEGISKINTDGAVSKQELRGAVACVCRDNRAEFLGASATVYDGLINPEVLGTLACSEALALAEDMHLNKLWVASDCLNVIKEINDGANSGQQCMIIKQIHLKRNQFSEAKFSHERREANGDAHRLARSATTLDIGRHVWFLNHPSDLGVVVNILNN